MTTTNLPKHSVIVDGHRTSISLEEQYWRLFKAVARRRGISINDLITEWDRERHIDQTCALPPPNLSSWVRVRLLQHLVNVAELCTQGFSLPADLGEHMYDLRQAVKPVAIAG
jgi:predicted DNA-binding ribbon-helix-helix protein